MTDAITVNTTSDTGSTDSLTPTPVTSSSKPYDDEMLESYEAEAIKEDPSLAKVEPEESKQEKPLDEPKEEETPTEEEPEAKATKDDKVIDGVEELPIKRMINGKEVEFKIKDAIQSYVKQEEFNRNMDRRLNDVSRRERAWKKEEETFVERIQDVVSKAQNGNFVDGISALAKLAAGKSDLDVVKFEKLYFEQLEKVREVYTKMTPEQRDAYFAKRSEAEARAKLEKLQSEKTSTEAQSQLQQQVNSLMQEHGLAPEEFWGNYKQIVDSQVGEGKPFQDPNEITADEVLKYSLTVRHWEKVYKAGESVGITDDAVLDEVGKITLAYPDLTQEDVVKVIKNAGLASPSAVENLNRKVGKNGQPQSAASSTKNKNGKIEGLDEEDLGFLYRNQPKAYSRIVR